MAKRITARPKLINKTAPKQAPGKLRIIGGAWRRRLLPVISAEGLRPTSDRVRETLFNWLQSELAGSRCLDLFAGSGALGLEAASRGASEVVMVEKSAAVHDMLKQNVQMLAASQVTLLQQDALLYIQKLTLPESMAFDIVFLDPPYQSQLLAPVMASLTLSSGTKVYLEAKKGDDIQVPANWLLLKDKLAGQIHYCLYEITN
ncbi:MAG: 16S rRNA (guanine(966)-N(2))-methyltransferase RsmD [Gammaproteobacteria bacterium]|nr:16S rRNA (guanine(966)-N(2))-methyltransferase RsmD [Gammaproteobacteria bacterium]